MKENGAYRFLRAAGLSNCDALSIGELSETENRDILVSFCNSQSCAGNMPSKKGRPVFIGFKKRCPLCDSKIIFRDLCSPEEIKRFKLRFGDIK